MGALVQKAIAWVVMTESSQGTSVDASRECQTSGLGDLEDKEKPRCAPKLRTAVAANSSLLGSEIGRAHV